MQPRGLGRLYDLAESQGGYFTTRQAAGVRVSTRLLTHYVAAGDVERVAHGVYRLTRFPPHRFGDAIAAALWAGAGSAISHDSALAVYGLGAAMPVAVHVTVPRPFRGSRAGMVVHHAPLASDEVTVWDDVPIVTVIRALVDVAAQIDPALAGDAARDAIERGLATPAGVAAYLAGRPDNAQLAAVLLPADDETIAR